MAKKKRPIFDHSRTLKVHLENSNYPDLQSSYRRCYNTETALVKVHNDILLNMNHQRVTLLIMLDLSAAFETVHHGFLLNILNSKLGLDCIALKWFDSYLKNRSYRVSVTSQNRFTQRQEYLRAFDSGHYYLTSMLVAYSAS